MNAKLSAEKLPESIRKTVEQDPVVSIFLQQGMELGETLGSPEWAAAWKAGADGLLIAVLRWIVVRNGALPFEEEQTETEAVQADRFTGAELRVGLARLRLSGVLFAVRKTWGERLYYIPADMVPIWQKLILPVAQAQMEDAAAGAVQPAPAPFRLPFSLELLPVWAAIRRNGIPLTVKGSVPKPIAAKLASLMRLTAGEIAPLGLTYPQHDQFPAAAALALDLGLCTGVLERRDKEIAVSPCGLAGWLPKSVRQADAELHRLAVLRYASAEPKRHLAASAVASCGQKGWFPDKEVLRIGIDPVSLELWLNLLVSLGWAERGFLRGEGVFRWLTNLDAPPGSTGPGEPDPIVVQPDGEIYVPPGAGLEARWKLEEISVRVAADRMFVYRLTRSSCMEAYEAGWRERDITEFLEKESGDSLPEPVNDSVKDWFARLGKVRIEEAVLLRTDSDSTARRLLEDPETASLLNEQAGSRDFIVPRSKLKGLVSRLEQLGYPPSEPARALEAAETPVTFADHLETGWVHSGHILIFHEPDKRQSAAEDLFPDLSGVPAAWLNRPGSYHVSTRRELIRKAIGWHTAVGIKEPEREECRLFVPQSIGIHGDKWEVTGKWRIPADYAADSIAASEVESVTLTPDMMGQLMIVLPGLAGSFLQPQD